MAALSDGIVTAAIILVAAFAGGAFGAAVGAIPAFAISGGFVIVGELWASLTAGGSGAASDLANTITHSLALGPLFGPHVAFAGGAAGAAYAARKGYVDAEFEYYAAKHVVDPLGSRLDVLAVGGVFGLLGVLIRRGSLAVGLPLNSIALAVVVSGVVHRLAFGYPLLGAGRGDAVLDATAYEPDRLRGPLANGGSPADEEDDADEQFVVESWVPETYEWHHVVALGVVVGALAGAITAASGSLLLAFGISAASLGLSQTDHDWIVPTHGITLPSATAAVAVAGGAAAATLAPALLVGAVFGTLGAVVGEVAQRSVYARGHTHVDSGFVAILLVSVLVALLALVGVFQSAAVV